MKKPVCEDKTKLVECIKTMSIVLLSVSCIVLGCYVFELYCAQDGLEWFKPTVIADPVNVDSQAENNQNSKTLLSELLQPEKILVNHINNRGEVQSNTGDFKTASELVGLVLKEAYAATEPTVETVSRDEWKNLMKSNSLYISFAGQKNAGIEMQFYKAPDSNLAARIKQYRDLVILPSSSSKRVTVYFADADYEKITKVILKTNMAEKLESFISSHADTDVRRYAFAYELNLDKTAETDEADHTRVVLNSFFLIPTFEETTANIIVNVPQIYKTGLSFTKTTDFTTRLISIFGYNPNTIRQYTNEGGALIFVGKTGSLSADPSGYIEYRALGKNEGISLVSEESNELLKSISGLAEMLNRVYTVSGVLQDYTDDSLRITDIKTDSDGQTIKVDIDYYVDNRKIEFGSSPAISARINNGVLTELNMLVKTAKKDESETKQKSVFDAIDEYCVNNPKITNIRTGKQIYRFLENGGEISAQWKIQGVM